MFPTKVSATSGLAKLAKGFAAQSMRPSTLSLETTWLLRRSGSSRKTSMKREQKQAAKDLIDTLKKIDHPNIVSIIHSEGWALGQDLQLFINLYDGDLRMLMAKNEINQCAPMIVKTMLEVRAFLAQMGVIHGDIKPENILFDRQRRFYLTDFGLIGPHNSPRGYMISEHYAAPEAYQQQMSPKSDVWSLGVVVLDILGKRPEFPPLLIWKDQKEQYQKSIMDVARGITRLPHMLSTLLTSRFNAATCLYEFFPNDRCQWPFRDTSSTDIEMTTLVEERRARSNPCRVRKGAQKKKNKKKKW